MKKNLRSLLLVAALGMSPVVATAAAIVGLTSNNELFTMANASAPGTISGPYAVTGIASGQTLVAIDYNPADGMLYALGYASGSGQAQLYTINTSTYAATAVNSTPLTLSLGNGNSVGFDFNPETDNQIHVAGTTGSHYMLNASSGAVVNNWNSVSYAPGDINSAATAAIGASAYTNSFYGADAATQMAYDLNNNTVVRFNSNNNSQLHTTGLSGLILSAGTGVGMDGYYDAGAHSNTVYLAAQPILASGSNLYTVNGTTGLAMSLGAIGGGNVAVKDIAVSISRNVPSAVTGTLVAGLTLNNGHLVFFDSDVPDVIRSRVAISGVTSGQSVIAIDYRPATMSLYALGYNGSTMQYQLYTVDASTGVATPVNNAASLNLGNASNVSFDFNPVTDRVHITAANGTNATINPATGLVVSNSSGVQYSGSDVNAGANANITSMAHTNSYNGATATQSFGLDMTTGALVNINFGANTTLQTLSSLTTLLSHNGNTGNNGTMDMYYDEDNTTNNAFMASNTEGSSDEDENYATFHTMNPNSYSTTDEGSVGQGVPVRDIAARPDFGGVNAVGAVAGKNSLRLYPNPATTDVHILHEGTAREVNLKILDVSGRVVAEQTITNPGSEITLHVKSLMAGVYMIQLRDGNGDTRTAKLIKQL